VEIKTVYLRCGQVRVLYNNVTNECNTELLCSSYKASSYELTAHIPATSPYIQGDKNVINLSAAVKPFPDAHATFYTYINLKCTIALTSAVKIGSYRKH
jgi:hypothetical protein